MFDASCRPSSADGRDANGRERSAGRGHCRPICGGAPRFAEDARLACGLRDRTGMPGLPRRVLGALLHVHPYLNRSMRVPCTLGAALRLGIDKLKRETACAVQPHTRPLSAGRVRDSFHFHGVQRAACGEP